ncbi:unnamed protein product [Larinioides sclopetarius]|uniref:Uncharacterized protein n=1 Tax=Larinioides sclopetarius TaxID=280406 RepID=A0AAV2B6Y8_9ARAC
MIQIKIIWFCGLFGKIPRGLRRGAFKIHQNKFFGKNFWCFYRKHDGSMEHTILIRDECV